MVGVRQEPSLIRNDHGQCGLVGRLQRAAVSDSACVARPDGGINYFINDGRRFGYTPGD